MSIRRKLSALDSFSEFAKWLNSALFGGDSETNDLAFTPVDGNFDVTLDYRPGRFYQAHKLTEGLTLSEASGSVNGGTVVLEILGNGADDITFPVDWKARGDAFNTGDDVINTITIFKAGSRIFYSIMN